MTEEEEEQQEQEQEQEEQQQQQLVSETICFCARHDATTCLVYLSLYGFQRHDVHALKLMNPV